MYSMLLVATPFLMLRNFLQPAIARFSRSGFELGGIEIPSVPVVALILVIVSIILFRAYLTRLRVLAGVLVLLMDGLGQQISDYYFAHKFYDLQQNWHYLAYTCFAVMVYRDLAPRGIRLAKIILITFSCAVLFSTFDESVQLGMSRRAFEMSDIAKDAWGSLMGIVLIYVGGSRPGALLEHWKQLRYRTLRGYFERPLDLMILLIALSLPFLCFASLLTEIGDWMLSIILTISSFIVFFVLFHLSRYRWVKYSLLTIVLAGLVVQSYFFLKYRSDDIVHNQYGLTVYKGIPLLFFDVMIFPDGMFRPVPKKHYFNPRCRKFLLRRETDIVLIGTGSKGLGGRGFPQETVSQFLYNPYTLRGTQVIILESPEACRVFNRLKRERKNVLFVLHNTC
jgi:VanZ family protein